MAEPNASSDYLPQLPRDRADSTMSLGAGITLTDNSAGNPPNGAGSLASPIATLPPDPTPPAASKAPAAMANPGDERLVQDVLTSEVNIWRTRERNKSGHLGLTGGLDRCCYHAQQT